MLFYNFYLNKARTFFDKKQFLSANHPMIDKPYHYKV